MVDIREQVRRHVGAALSELGGEALLTGEQVHEARRSLKRARAGLRLMRDGMEPAAYSRDLARVRDAARPLGPLRDAAVMLEVLPQFVEGSQTAAALARVLKAERVRLRKALRHGTQLEDIRRSLRQVVARLRDWPPPAQGNLCNGIRRIYRRGRTVLLQIESDHTAENMHEWRKQVKSLGDAVRMLAAPAHGGKPVAQLQHIAAAAAAVAECLGDDNDLAVLAARITARSAQAGGSMNKASSDELLARIGRLRKKLQRKALMRGRVLYQQPPGVFARRVARFIGSGAAAPRPPKRTGAANTSIALGRARQSARQTIRSGIQKALGVRARTTED